MDDDEGSEGLFYLGLGPLAALFIGIGLVPFREATVASNFTFVFLALTIVVAELGGRWPAVATALASALSLDFFLTQPYLRLSIENKQDVIAFGGLCACGLLAAALASDRGRRTAGLAMARRRLSLLQSAIRQLGETAAPERSFPEILRGCREALPVAGAVVRNARELCLAASGHEDALRPVPLHRLTIDTLLPVGTQRTDLSNRSVALPPEGGRVELTFGARHVGWLDVWGSGAPASVEARRVLSDFARVLAARLASVSAVE